MTEHPIPWILSFRERFNDPGLDKVRPYGLRHRPVDQLPVRYHLNIS